MDSHQHVALFLLSYLQHKLNRLTKKRQKGNQKSDGSNGRKIETLVTLPIFNSFFFSLFPSLVQRSIPYMCLQKKKGKSSRRCCHHTLCCATHITLTRVCACVLGTTPPPIRQFQPTLAILFNTAHTAKNIVQTVCGSQKGIDRKWCSGEKRSSGCADGRLASSCGLQGLAAETVLAHTGRSWHIKSCLLEERCTAPTTDVTYELPLRQVRSP